ncbi:hypothetical protein [Subtercola endophyticus]|uniref:hypothetical protein n=1 Tax=Subtercola endophyticus TaxID=2895559 RepID=UPI001E402E8E|nr:hypothetical protein [Subtercola endophyticus]UFS60408.1 hypothetical protein LQ955_06585 [Subtercola endophyticus]
MFTTVEHLGSDDPRSASPVSNPLFRRVWSEHSARLLASGTAWISIDGSEMVGAPWQVPAHHLVASVTVV